MSLLKEERSRAISLQRRLKFLRWWDKVGVFFCYPWTFYKKRQEQWLIELTNLYHKMSDDRPTTARKGYNGKDNDIVRNFCSTRMGNPVKWTAAVKGLEQTFNGLRRTAEGVSRERR